MLSTAVFYVNPLNDPNRPDSEMNYYHPRNAQLRSKLRQSFSTKSKANENRTASKEKVFFSARGIKYVRPTGELGQVLNEADQGKVEQLSTPSSLYYTLPVTALCLTLYIIRQKLLMG